MSTQLANLVRSLRRLDAREHSDGQLLRQFAETGDEDAFALLVRRHGQLVFGVCRRILGHVHDAEDAAQATFLVLARKAGAIAWEDSIAGWLHEVAVRVSLDARHALYRRRAREQQTTRLPDKIFVAEKDAADRADCLDEELSRLPAKLRAPLILCYLKGCTPHAHLGQRRRHGRRGFARRTGVVFIGLALVDSISLLQNNPNLDSPKVLISA